MRLRLVISDVGEPAAVTASPRSTANPNPTSSRRGSNSDSNAPKKRVKTCASASQILAKLFARRAGVHIDFHAKLHFKDLWCFPVH